MNREKEYYETVDLLLDAFSRGTLMRGSCAACAVGNICAKNLGVKILGLKSTSATDECQRYPHSFWYTTIRGWSPDTPEKDIEGNRAIDSTPYTRTELLKIESSFEAVSRIDAADGTQLHGLTAVLDTLKEIHGVDQQVSEVSQNKLYNVHNELHPENVMSYEV